MSAARVRHLNRTTLETARLTLRPWRAADAVTYQQLWLERDPRVPAEQRIDADGRPDLADLQQRIRTMERGVDLRPWAVEDEGTGEMLGYCGLVPGEQPDEPKVVIELLRRAWGQGYATEALSAVVEQAHGAGFRRLTATVYSWNARALHLLSGAEFSSVEADADRGAPIQLVRPV